MTSLFNASSMAPAQAKAETPNQRETVTVNKPRPRALTAPIEVNPETSNRLEAGTVNKPWVRRPRLISQEMDNKVGRWIG